ncbi:F-box only protein 15-like [Rhopilema esculentum]|uniref:F-box only protein 15-like n=1 Tax=Rhopilema esculentum TaxID=499914 RepID=UPI0031CF50D8
MKRRPRFVSKLTNRIQKIASNNKSKSGPHINYLPSELLLKIFEYLSPSDILRCARTCKLWLEECNQNDLWRQQFRKLPGKVQKFSLEAKKPTENINWKRETITCLKKSRKKHVSMLMKKKSRYSGLPEKTTETIRYLDVQWAAVITDTEGNDYTLLSKEATYYTTSLSVCWNDIDLPPVGRLASCRIFAQCPVFQNSIDAAQKDSAFTRSLMAEVSLKGSAFDQTHLLGKDYHVSSYAPLTDLVFGLWHDDITQHRNIAFITLNRHFLNIIDNLLNGTSARMYAIPQHEPILDDLDGKYGLQRYSALIELRTSRKLLWNHKVMEFLKGHVEDGYLIMTDERAAYQSCFDIHKPLSLPWKAGAIKGVIQNLAVLDFSLIDSNGEFIWHTSKPIRATPDHTIEVNFESETSENFQMVLNDEEKGTTTLSIAVDPETECCAVRRIEIRLKTSYINVWFGTSY